ncbi:MAG TPA: hypothetical protein VFE37_11470 [Chloroflexota bacterium]|nr:hypothetical protein [Chloroflexota bacterium]
MANDAPPADPFPRLVALLLLLEDAQPYVTVEDVCARWEPASETEACRALVAEAIADRRLFTDRRQRFDPATATFHPVRLVRLNRRHPVVAPLV